MSLLTIEEVQQLMSFGKAEEFPYRVAKFVNDRAKDAIIVETNMDENDERYVDIKWVCKYTGISRSMIYQLCDPEKTDKDKLLPCYMPLNKRFFKKSEIEKWMQRAKIRAS